MTANDTMQGLGFTPRRSIFVNVAPAKIVEAAISRQECMLTADGAIAANTGKHTGRSAGDKFVVDEGQSAANVWWGTVNHRLDSDKFAGLKLRVFDDLAGRELFVFHGYAGADAAHRIKVRVVTPYAWHCLFARNMFIVEPDPQALRDFVPDFTIYHDPDFEADPNRDGTRSSTFILVNFAQNMALIGGTHYAGEIKKTIFTVMNKLLPDKGLLSMHCSANYGKTKDDVALFFGLSGTGKTTLSADAERTLIGDDEHGWGPHGVFNFEGGCYAKVINLSAEGEPEIYAASRRFGTVLENVVLDPNTRYVDFADGSRTENTRSCYPIAYIPNADVGGTAGHPKHVVFLTADAYGVLPPIARLDTAQAMYHYLSGYTAKVAGTEIGVKEPSATFSACFGAPFLPLHPNTYAELFGEYIERFSPKVWLVNTGWTGGPYGSGSRMKLSHTRRMIRAALAGELDGAPVRVDPIFGLRAPEWVDGVPSAVLDPRGTWINTADYDAAAARLAKMFSDNFQQFADVADEKVKAAGPRVPV